MGKKRIISKSENTDSAPEAKSGISVGSRKKQRQVFKGVASIFSSYNNTIISISDNNGEVLAWSSAGSLGFKGARKSTPYAATQVAKEVLEKAKKYGLGEIAISVKGIGPGREAAIRALAGAGLNVTALVDNTPLPHNGVRPPKPRRV